MPVYGPTWRVHTMVLGDTLLFVGLLPVLVLTCWPLTASDTGTGTGTGRAIPLKQIQIIVVQYRVLPVPVLSER